MTFDPDDPRLTAYALGELDDAERVEFEAFIAVGRTRPLHRGDPRTARLLAERLGRERSPGLAPRAASVHREAAECASPDPAEAPAAAAHADPRPCGTARRRRQHHRLRGRAGCACLQGDAGTPARAGPGHETAGLGTNGRRDDTQLRAPRRRRGRCSGRDDRRWGGENPSGEDRPQDGGNKGGSASRCAAFASHRQTEDGECPEAPRGATAIVRRGAGRPSWGLAAGGSVPHGPSGRSGADSHACFFHKSGESLLPARATAERPPQEPAEAAASPGSKERASAMPGRLVQGCCRYS